MFIPFSISSLFKEHQWDLTLHTILTASFLIEVFQSYWCGNDNITFIWRRFIIYTYTF
jgi:hypothetical protein